MTKNDENILILKLINARRHRYGINKPLALVDIKDKNTMAYVWAEDNVAIFKEYLNSRTPL